MKTTRSIQIIRFAVLALLCLPLYGGAWDRTPATTFATLPHGATNPEGITVDPHGKFYVSTFAVGGTESGLGEIFVFSPGGSFLRKIRVQGSSTLLLEIAFHPTTGAFLVIDFGMQQVLDVDPLTGSSVVFTTIPGGASAGPNVMTFDSDGRVYITDSFQGIIWRIAAHGGTAEPWIDSALLRTTGVPPFGANGLAFNKAEDVLFVANTGNDTIVKIPLPSGPSGTPGAPEAFVSGINGADGVIIDRHGDLWVAANQADEIVVIEPVHGRVIAKLGDFDGIDRHGRVDGLLFPASLIRVGRYIYVTNLALDLRIFGAPTVDAPWAAEVRKFTVSKIPARIPAVGSDRDRHRDRDGDDDDDDDHRRRHD